jgi:uncharacterized protein (UPF0332 family)
VSEITEEQWLGHAHRRLDDARFLIENGRIQTALSQLYFALFYACQALLRREGLGFKSHSSVGGNVGRFPEYRQRLGTSLPAQLQDEREACDYQLQDFEVAHVEERLRQVHRFIDEVDKLLR